MNDAQRTYLETCMSLVTNRFALAFSEVEDHTKEEFVRLFNEFLEDCCTIGAFGERHRNDPRGDGRYRKRRQLVDWEQFEALAQESEKEPVEEQVEEPADMSCNEFVYLGDATEFHANLSRVVEFLKEMSSPSNNSLS